MSKYQEIEILQNALKERDEEYSAVLEEGRLLLEENKRLKEQVVDHLEIHKALLSEQLHVEQLQSRIKELEEKNRELKQIKQRT